MEIEGAQLTCPYCKAQLQVPAKASTRAFMIVFNRFRRQHDDRCGPRYRVEAQVANAKMIANEAMDRLFKT